jgi:hypothetical protein
MHLFVGDLFEQKLWCRALGKALPQGDAGGKNSTYAHQMLSASMMGPTAFQFSIRKLFVTNIETIRKRHA